MKKIFLPILALMICSSQSLFGQKNEKIVPATQSSLTVLSLPAGSMQDKRGLSTYSAKILIETETRKAGVGIKNTPEVFLLPPVSKSHYNADSLMGSLQALGWSIQPVQGDTKFTWLKKDKRYVMAYFSMGKNGTDLYLAEAADIPGMAPATGTVLPTNGQGQTNTTYQTANNTGSSSVNPAGNAGIQNTPAATKGANSTGANSPGAGSFVYRTTNFDDGWASTIADDKVIVTKGNLRVFIYHTIAYTDESRNAGRNWPWQNIISRDFNIRSTQYRDHGEVMSLLQPPYVEGKAIEKTSGQNVFIAMYVLSSSGRMMITLAIAPEEQTIRNAFPKAEDKYESDLNAMRGYNRFAVDATDLTGTWTGGESAAVNYYDSYSGNYMGMNAAVVSDKFVFAANNTYSSEHNGGTGQVGNMRTFQQSFKGNYSVDKWSITMNNRFDGKTENFNCYFEGVRGGRILHMQNKQYTGTWYHLVKTN